MRYQQQQARMSPNWREKEAMSTTKLMAATTHLHLKQDEEIIRLRRNISSLAKKNHGLMRQVHELVSRLRQYLPTRIPEDTRPKTQDEELQQDPSHESEEDTQMENSTGTEPTEQAPQPNMEYDILPDVTEEYLVAPGPPPPAPTPPIPQVQLQPVPLPPAVPLPLRIEAKRHIKEPARVGHTPPPETPIPADTHPDEEVQITIAGMEWYEIGRQDGIRVRYNRRSKSEDGMTKRGWMWFNKVKGRHTLCGGEEHEERCDIKAIKRGDKYFVGLGDIKDADKESIAGYNGKYLIGFQGVKEKRGDREKIQIVIE